MVVFGNSTLDNQSGTSGGLESFYFSSELGQIVCEKIPFDGMGQLARRKRRPLFHQRRRVDLDGYCQYQSGEKWEMEVSMYRGSARIVANGEEQYFGAGQK